MSAEALAKADAVSKAAASGGKLLEIVPGRDRLVVEAHINPDDADDVRPGTAALSPENLATPQAQPEGEEKIDVIRSITPSHWLN